MISVLIDAYRKQRPTYYYGPRFFDRYAEDDWITTDFAKKVIKEIEGNEVIMPGIIYNTYFERNLTMDYLSGGVKTLISIYQYPHLMFDILSMGQNCIRQLEDISHEMDFNLALSYLAEFRYDVVDKIYLINEDRYIKDDIDFVLTFERITSADRKRYGIIAVCDPDFYEKMDKIDPKSVPLMRQDSYKIEID